MKVHVRCFSPAAGGFHALVYVAPVNIGDIWKFHEVIAGSAEEWQTEVCSWVARFRAQG